MSQDYKSRFSQMRDNDLATPQDNSGTDGTAESDQYVTGSNVRNIDFIWPDGHRKFLNYGFLVSCDYFPEANSIILEFTTHTVTLKGVRLEGLYVGLLDHLPRIIACNDARYNSISKDGPVINEIIFSKNG